MRNNAFSSSIIILSLIFSLLLPLGSANATWITILNENFVMPWASWPWFTWGHQWVVLPAGGYRWGIAANFSHYPFEPLQSIWCAGLLNSQPSNLTPFIDQYPPNLNTKTIWGPFSLQNAVSAQCSFWYWNDTQQLYDYLLWGASLDPSANTIYEGGRASGPNASWDWLNGVMDFSELVTSGGDTVSLIGQSQVWLVFLFHSNNSIQTTWGGFLDDIALSYDDGIYPNITLTPVNPPIIIPAIGGSFNYTVDILNNSISPVTFNAWIDITLPNGSIYGPVINRNLTLASGASLLRELTQNVPGNAPAGQYYCNGYVGTYPDTVWDSTSFDFVKQGMEKSAYSNDFNIYGWDENRLLQNDQSEIRQIYSTPNPFNSSTIITFDLSVAIEVSLKVYDISSREIGSLVTGHLSLGKHQMEWNAQGLPSGIYFARLQAGEFTQTQKLVLMK